MSAGNWDQSNQLRAAIRDGNMLRAAREKRRAAAATDRQDVKGGPK